MFMFINQFKTKKQNNKKKITPGSAQDFRFLKNKMGPVERSHSFILVVNC